MFFLLLIAAFGICNGFTEYQEQIVRQQSINHKAPPGSAIVDAILVRSDYAFTDQVRLICHVDAVRFQCCPNSFANAVIHEIHHLNQRQHTIGVKDDPMSYILSIQPNGDVINDNYVLPPLNPAQPWYQQIAQQPLTRMVTPPPTQARLSYLPLPTNVITPVQGPVNKRPQSQTTPLVVFVNASNATNSST